MVFLKYESGNLKLDSYFKNNIERLDNSDGKPTG
jgi:hypothetical protein